MPHTSHSSNRQQWWKCWISTAIHIYSRWRRCKIIFLTRWVQQGFNTETLPITSDKIRTLLIRFNPSKPVWHHVPGVVINHSSVRWPKVGMPCSTEQEKPTPTLFKRHSRNNAIYFNIPIVLWKYLQFISCLQVTKNINFKWFPQPSTYLEKVLSSRVFCEELLSSRFVSAVSDVFVEISLQTKEGFPQHSRFVGIIFNSFD